MGNALEAVTNEQAVTVAPPRPVAWYRTPLDTKILQNLHLRSDFWGSLQTFGYLGVLLLTGGVAFYSAGRWPWWATVLLVFLHGTVFAFQINAVHELGHGTVFKTRRLNWIFERVFGFLGWINFHSFDTSHVRHHQYTLHPPDDLEVVLPAKIAVKDFFKSGFIAPLHVRWIVMTNLRFARGKFVGDWELKLFPESNPAKRRPLVRWSQFILAGHAIILVGSIAAAVLGHPRFLMLPLLLSCGQTYGSWLFFLCNNTQHIGLQDNVPDFRLCCRTFTLNPVVQFLYWHMNYHIEHHMYAAVPCYKLGRLHRLIEHDLPACPRSIAATWREIAAILKIQKQDPAYQHLPPCPNPRPKDVEKRAAAPVLQPA